MKKIYIPILLSVILMASPMPEQQALDLFASIKKSEYNWALAQWRNEMHIKTRSRTSTRKSVWGANDTLSHSFDRRTNDPLREIPPSTEVINPPTDPFTVPDI